jgi:hypothetical protein
LVAAVGPSLCPLTVKVTFCPLPGVSSSTVSCSCTSARPAPLIETSAELLLRFGSLSVCAVTLAWLTIAWLLLTVAVMASVGAAPSASVPMTQAPVPAV